MCPTDFQILKTKKKKDFFYKQKISFLHELLIDVKIEIFTKKRHGVVKVQNCALLRKWHGVL